MPGEYVPIQEMRKIEKKYAEITQKKMEKEFDVSKTSRTRFETKHMQQTKELSNLDEAKTICFRYDLNLQLAMWTIWRAYSLNHMTRY